MELDNIGIHHDLQRGLLMLSCGEASFARIRDLVVAEAGLKIPVDGLWTIEVEKVPAKATHPNWVVDRLALVGCSVISFVLGFVLLIGLWEIIHWMR